MKNVVLYIFVANSFFAQSANADSIVWTGNLQFSDYSCSALNKDEIVVRGAVTVVNPVDIDPHKPPAKVSILCDKFTFEKDASLSSISSMDIRISKVTSGPVKLVSLRGVKGDDAKDTPEIWGVVKMKHGGPVGRGANGDDAQCKIGDSHDSSSGKKGPRGNDGEDGRQIVAPKGASGLAGGTASDIVFLTASFAPGSSVEVTAVGGGGGSGNRGGRGADGGDASDGGIGGKGGNSCSTAGIDTHSASDGGPGGDGGNGGHGGNGGPGGDGGPGGNGGSVTIGLLEGNGSVPTPVISNGGGIGGDPGVGGERGEGGKRGEGAVGGCGGSGYSGPLGIGGTPGGHCAGAGQPGKNGDPGDPGPIGQKGKDGDPGHIGPGFAGTLPKAVWQTLVPGGS